MIINHGLQLPLTHPDCLRQSRLKSFEELLRSWQKPLQAMSNNHEKKGVSEMSLFFHYMITLRS